MISKVADLDLIFGYRMEPTYLVVHHLQYANDTLILVKHLVENIQSIKAIFRGFEHTLSLRVTILKQYDKVRVNIFFFEFK